MQMQCVYMIIQLQHSLAQKDFTTSLKIIRELDDVRLLQNSTDRNSLYLLVISKTLKALHFLMINDMKQLGVTLKGLETDLEKLIETQKGKKNLHVFEWIKFHSMIILESLLCISYFTSSGQLKQAEIKLSTTRDVLNKRLDEYLKQMERGVSFNLMSQKDIHILLEYDFFLNVSHLIVSLTKCDYVTCITILSDLIRLVTKFPNMSVYKCHIHLFIGILLSSLDKKQEAIKHLEYVQKNGANVELIAWAELVQISTFIGTELKQEEKEFFFETLDRLKNLNESNVQFGLATAIVFLRGILCHRNEALGEAMLHHKNGLLKSDAELKNSQLTSLILQSLSKLYFETSDLTSFHKCLSTSLLYSSKIGDLETELVSSKMLEEAKEVLTSQQDFSQSTLDRIQTSDQIQEMLLERLENLGDLTKIIDWWK